MQQKNKKVQFNEEQQFTRSFPHAAKQSALTRLIIKARLAKDERGASRVLLAIAAIVAIAAIWIAFSTFWAPPPSPHIQSFPPNIPVPPSLST